MAKTYCPNCDAVISVDSPHLGAEVICPECGVELEIIETDPYFDVDFLDDDWDDEEWEDDEWEEEE